MIKPNSPPHSAGVFITPDRISTMYTMELTPEQIEMNDIPTFPEVPQNHTKPSRNVYKVYGRDFNSYGRDCIGVITLVSTRNFRSEPSYLMEYTHKVSKIDIVLTIDDQNYGMEFCEDLIKQGATFEKI